MQNTANLITEQGIHTCARYASTSPSSPTARPALSKVSHIYGKVPPHLTSEAGNPAISTKSDGAKGELRHAVRGRSSHSRRVQDEKKDDWLHACRRPATGDGDSDRKTRAKTREEKERKKNVGGHDNRQLPALHSTHSLTRTPARSKDNTSAIKRS